MFVCDAPRLGEHNRYILHDLLGHDDEAIAMLHEQKVITGRPPV